MPIFKKLPTPGLFDRPWSKDCSSPLRENGGSAMLLMRISGILGLILALNHASQGAQVEPTLQCAGKDQPLIENNEKVSKFLSHIQPAKAVVLVIHGLNLKPTKMMPIVQTLNEAGYDVVRGALSGHLGNEDEFKSVTRDIWLNDLLHSYCQARALADSQKLPLHFVGFSLGGLVNLDLMNTHPEALIHYDRMVLLAPAAAIHSKSYLIKFFRLFGNGFVVPSLANREYRANVAGTPMAAYNALFDSIDHLEASGIKQKDLPTLILIDPKDELVSQEGLESMIETNQLSNWSLTPVSNFDSQMESGKYHHLIIDESSLGTSQWHYLKANLLNHLEGNLFNPTTYRIHECGKTGFWKTPKADLCDSDSDASCSRYHHVCVSIQKPGP